LLPFKKNRTDAEASQAEPKSSNLLKNFLNLLSGRFVGDIATFVLFIVLTRSFGEEGIGQYSIATMIGGICLLVADFGLYTYTLKEVGRHRHAVKDRYSEIIITRLLCTVVVLVCFVPIVLVAPVSIEVKWIWILIGSSQLFMGLMGGFAAIFVAHERMDIGAIIESSASWLVAVNGIAAASLGVDLVTVCTTILLAYFVSFLCMANSYLLLRRGSTNPRLPQISWVLRFPSIGRVSAGSVRAK
jgi:O-antigen/teichoic acid export membrane protein